MNFFSLNFILTVSIFCRSVYGALKPLDDPFQSKLKNQFLPNVRDSLQDCHLKYYKYGQSNQVAPAFGSPAYLKEFAHIAAIGWTTDNTIAWNCGGSLITENFILTAAHCAVDDRDISPDVARMGDINIYSSDDDKYAQQIKIVEVIRHPKHKFSLRYNDIALMRLEKKITVHETVTPACLWIDDKIRFPKLLAAGWGATGFSQDKTPILLKVALKPVENSECTVFYKTGDRRLPNAIMPEQICAGDEKMDTCPGDSGGPLEVKLLSNAKITPFLVGITSFGKACGASIPGVYTRISAYLDWITSVVNETYDPIECALRYIKFREYEDDVFISRSESQDFLNSDRAHMHFAEDDYNHRVAILWQSGGKRCGGVLISEDFVVTSAQCLNNAGKQPSQIQHINGKVDVKRIFVHPGYKTNSYYNDIALLKLSTDVKFTKELKPACLWSLENIPSQDLEVTGWGPENINKFNYGGTDLGTSDIKYLAPRAEILKNNNCSIAKDFQGSFEQGVKDEQLCTGNSLFVVPKSCDLDIGGPVGREVYRTNRYFPHIFGINSFGLDCGFGEPSISSRISYHIGWIESVVLPVPSETFLFLQDQDGNECRHIDGSEGLCVANEMCPKMVEAFKKNKQSVKFCSIKQKVQVCCPKKFVVGSLEKRKGNKEIDNCPALYRNFYKKYEQMFTREERNFAIGDFPSTAVLGFKSKDGTTAWKCLGTLITKNAILTTANCAAKDGTRPDFVRLGSNQTSNLGTQYLVSETTVHPNYDATSNTDDIAIVKFKGNLKINNKIVPACVWHNNTHTPFDLDVLLLKIDYPNITSTRHFIPMYNSDCQKQYSSNISHDNLCLDYSEVENGKPYNTCLNTGDPTIFNMVNGEIKDGADTTPYIVGLFNYQENCQVGNPVVFTRVSSYVEWIKSVI